MPQHWSFGLVLAVVFAQLAGAQQLQIFNPEAIAGRWEVADGQGGMIGMAITLVTHVLGRPDSLVGEPQYLDQFEIGLFRRNGPQVAPLGFNFYLANANVGVTWDGKHLAIHAPETEDQTEVSVNLTWRDKAKVWTGLFERGGFRRQVTLRRPANSHTSAFVGTWIESRGPTCVHIAQQADGAFTAWSDILEVPGRMRYANGIQPPAQTLESYGDIAEVQRAAFQQLVINMSALTPMCCSHSVEVKLSSDARMLVVHAIAGPNSPLMAVEWNKVADDGCVAAASEARW